MMGNAHINMMQVQIQVIKKDPRCLNIEKSIPALDFQHNHLINPSPPPASVRQRYLIYIPFAFNLYYNGYV